MIKNTSALFANWRIGSYWASDLMGRIDSDSH